MSRQQKGPQGRKKGQIDTGPVVQSRDAVDVVKAERVRFIAKAMSTGEWGPVLRAELEDKWKLGESTMNRDIAEASRYARGAVASDEELLEDLRTVARGRLSFVAEKVKECWAQDTVGAIKAATALEKSAAEYLRILLTDTRGKGKGSQKEEERAMSLPVEELRVLLAASGWELKKVDDETERD